MTGKEVRTTSNKSAWNSWDKKNEKQGIEKNDIGKKKKREKGKRRFKKREQR